MPTTLSPSTLLVICLVAMLGTASLVVAGAFALRERRLRTQKRNMKHIRTLGQIASRQERRR
jgi:hypothetical protein